MILPELQLKKPTFIIITVVIINPQGPSRQIVYDPNDVARTTIKETNIHNNHSGNMNPQIIKTH